MVAHFVITGSFMPLYLVHEAATDRRLDHEPLGIRRDLCSRFPACRTGSGASRFWLPFLVAGPPAALYYDGPRVLVAIFFLASMVNGIFPSHGDDPLESVDAPHTVLGPAIACEILGGVVRDRRHAQRRRAHFVMLMACGDQRVRARARPPMALAARSSAR